MIAVLDLGFGNVSSVMNMLKKLGVPAYVANTVELVERSSSIILPGVGSFDACMNLTRVNAEIFAILEDKVLREKVPFLGICVGMQMLFESSEEGVESGLCWIPGKVKRFKFSDTKIKIPHMGWREITVENGGGQLLDSECISRFYFVHSYYVECSHPEASIATCEYGQSSFSAAVNQGNIYGVQFHPEKSHMFGLSVLRAFSRITHV
jgi:glutamine amidotransferase